MNAIRYRINLLVALSNVTFELPFFSHLDRFPNDGRHFSMICKGVYYFSQNFQLINRILGIERGWNLRPRHVFRRVHQDGIRWETKISHLKWMQNRSSAHRCIQKSCQKKHKRAAIHKIDEKCNRFIWIDRFAAFDRVRFDFFGFLLLRKSTPRLHDSTLTTPRPAPRLPHLSNFSCGFFFCDLQPRKGTEIEKFGIQISISNFYF